MQPTRRFWEALGIAAVLTVAALVFAHPVLLLAPAGVLAWLLASQLGFVAAVSRLDESLSIAQTSDRDAAVTGDPVTVTLQATGDAAGLETTVTAHTSAGLDHGGDRQTDLGAPTSFTVTSDIAGLHHVEPPEVEVRDPMGLFVERFTRGDELELVVRPRSPRNVHVGEGGEELPDAFGEHTLETTGSGLMPAELRQYVAGEPVSSIDWKATARLATPYVREFEADSDQTTLLIVDARSNLQIGSTGETAFDYLRTIALSHVAVAQRLGDPIGCFSIDDQGIHRIASPTTAARGYELARRRLRGLSATTGRPRPRRTPPIQRRLGQFNPETRYGDILQTYATALPTTDPESNPLQAAVRNAITTHTGALRIVLFTDDSDRADIQAAVREVRRSEYSLDLFLAPTVLFEPGTLADLPRATERYRDFEQFRRQLLQVDGVAAYEVAPKSRIETVLEEARSVLNA